VVEAVQQGSIGDLFFRVDDPVVLFRSGEAVAWNRAAQEQLGMPAPPVDRLDLWPYLGEATVPLLAMVQRAGGGAQLHCEGGCGLVLDTTVWALKSDDEVAVLFRDVTRRQRLSDGMARLSALGRELLGSEPSLPDLLQRLADEAKTITGAAFSGVLLLRVGGHQEITHFAYNAPRELFPERLPRAVGLIQVALDAGAPVRLDDIRGAEGSVGIPVKHPPIAALLSAPVVAGDSLIGLVVVANEPGQRCFDEADEALVVDLAAHAGTAVKWAQARELASLQAARRRETAAVARHDVRNPLAAGKGYARMLTTKADRMSAEMKAEAYQHMFRVFERIEEFTERLLLTDDMVAPSGQPQWQDIELDDLLRRLTADHQAAAQPTDGAFVVVKQPDAPLLMAADPSMAREALDNLIGNAYKYGTAGQPVTLTVRAEGDQVRFDVHNHGDGIPADEQAQVFDRYWRPDRVRDSHVAGSGLGLAIVREIAEVHGGVVGVSSRSDEGTTFWITFPIGPAA
jgi:signal transduction histidine kinase